LAPSSSSGAITSSNVTRPPETWQPLRLSTNDSTPLSNSTSWRLEARGFAAVAPTRTVREHSSEVDTPATRRLERNKSNSGSLSCQCRKDPPPCVCQRTERFSGREDHCRNDPHALRCGPLTVNGTTRRSEMTLGTILLIVLVLILLGVIPRWSHSRSWGYMPSSVVGVVAVVLVLMLLTGRL
jgi:hypothetical protein